MVGSLIVYALTLIGPAAVAGGYRPATRGGLMVVLVMSLAAALTLGVLLGRWLSQRASGETGEGEEEVFDGQ